MKPNEQALPDSISADSTSDQDILEIIELDERLDLTMDPLLSFSDTCCGNAANCGC